MPEKEIAKSERKASERMAVVLVRGLVKVKKRVKDTLKMMRLTHKNHCVVIEDSPVNKGMLQKAKDYITWGEISEEMFKELVEKRGQIYHGPVSCTKGKIKYNKFFIFNGKKYLKYFRLNPPRQGFGRRGIKIPFKLGGGLGYRGKKIEDLLRRMV